MPLIAFLRDNYHKPFGWHRNEERQARGMPLTEDLEQILEPWEHQLVLVEILLLGGGTPYANFSQLAHAWGREKGFHTAVVERICQSRGEIIRKRKLDLVHNFDSSTVPSNTHPSNSVQNASNNTDQNFASDDATTLVEQQRQQEHHPPTQLSGLHLFHQQLQPASHTNQATRGGHIADPTNFSEQQQYI